MNQQPLWIDDMRGAIQALVDVVGPKAIGAALWPKVDPADAARQVQHCLNPNRRERFSDEDLLVMLKVGRKHNCHVLAAHLMREAGYEEPRPLDLQAEAERVSQDVEALHERARKRMEQFARITEILKVA